jgi:Protein of unknown function (DUF1460)
MKNPENPLRQQCQLAPLAISGNVAVMKCSPRPLMSVLAAFTACIFRASAAAPAPVPPANPPRLPLETVFKGESKFKTLCEMAEREKWRQLPLGERTVRVARAMVGTQYVNYTLEVDDRIESPVVNLQAMDCWTYYENALAFARMLRYKPGPYLPQDMLHMVEVERYRNGVCTGNYLSRMHQLEEVFYDNQRRGYAQNITPYLPGAERLHREIHEMTVQWQSYRYLKNNPSLLPQMGKIEEQVSKLPVYHIPKDKVRSVENYLADGDICAITANATDSYTSHVGMIMRLNGRAYFSHATSDRDKGRMVIIDCPISDYLKQGSKHAGIVILRPKDLPPSALWQKGYAGN